MRGSRLVFRLHAIQRMFQRQITEDDVRHVLATGQVIEDYPDDTPYPSCLILGWGSNRPLHVVAAYNAENEETIIITAYEPEPGRWDETFTERKP